MEDVYTIYEGRAASDLETADALEVLPHQRFQTAILYLREEYPDQMACLVDSDGDLVYTDSTSNPER